MKFVNSHLFMGNVKSSFHRLLARLWRSSDKDTRVLMIGLDGAGKTTLLYQFKYAENVKPIPTIGFNVETMHINKLQITVWDIGGQSKIRPLWRYYFQGSHALIWVIDSSDVERLNESKEELHSILNEPDLSSSLLLVYANKSDLPTSLDYDIICKKLDLASITNRKWHIQQCCGITGEGLYEGMHWLTTMLKK
jgi:ADP-ribosylation factor 1/2